MTRRKWIWTLFALAGVTAAAVLIYVFWPGCGQASLEGFRPIAADRLQRFLGKVSKETAVCRGGGDAVQFRATPWVDWQRYWATGDASSQGRAGTDQDRRGVTGALTDLEYQRMELIKFNLFDNNGTYEQYVKGSGNTAGSSLTVWNEMRLPPGHPDYKDVGGDGPQLCTGNLIRSRTLTGICNDFRNPLMGSTNQLFGRLVELDATFPDLGKTELARNRHAGRLQLLQPDPQVVSRKLFSRVESHPEKCRGGQGLDDDSKDADCGYQKANSFNVLAAFWIQFMTHDWFSHLEEGHNAPELMKTGCQPPADAAKLGCRPDDVMDRALIADASDPPVFDASGKAYLTRAYKTTRNNVTAWWDASQIYGYDETSLQRVKRDPKDRAKLLLDSSGYLPILSARDPMNPEWQGQEATAFPDNWSIGLSFYHNVFAREHNAFVTAFRKQATLTPGDDCGLRNPSRPDQVIAYRDVTADELFDAARLVISAEIAKIHTIEWTTQLLYDEPLYRGMNANWSGLFGGNQDLSHLVSTIAGKIGESGAANANQLFSVFASGAGIFGLGSTARGWNIANADLVNGGTHHFGVPFNFPEEFITVYRLHPLVPDLMEYREVGGNPNTIRKKIAMVKTFRGLATERMHSAGIANWAVSLGRQRSGTLTLNNHPQFLQSLPMPRLHAGTNLVDVAALDILRDRERGVPRFNEFRRQLGLRQLTSFDDFTDVSAKPGSAERASQDAMIHTLREVYGQHICDASKTITDAQPDGRGDPLNDCLGHPNGTLVDNIEDVDTVVGWLAESTRPHGFAISETQFQVFILNASRRLFSDRFFTSSFRPEFYTSLGVQWITDNGPDGKVMEKGSPNGHPQEVLPLKRVLLRTIPELAPELAAVINSFDPWARDRGEYYSLEWKARAGAESDEAFAQK
jgi:Animal haem peroxidase